MAGIRFAITPEEQRAYEADAWAQPHLNALADDWEQRQLARLNAEVAPPPSPVQAPTPSDSLTNPVLQGPSSAGAETVSPQTAQPSPEPSTSPAPALPAPSAPPPTDFGPVPRANPAQRPLGSPPAVPTPAPAPTPSPTGNLVDYARQAAARAGIDPDLFVRQINQESGFNPASVSPAGARGIAQIVPRWHPGVNPDDPTASLDYAANLMANLIKQYGDVRTALVAYNGGGGAVQALNAGTPYQESKQYVDAILGAGRGVPQTADLGRPPAISLSQFGDRTLTAEEAYAACGPAAAARLASEYGNNIPLSAALAAAKQVGWTPGGGMNGIANEKKLMDALGLPAELDTSGDWNKIVNAAGNGQLVTISTPGHYFSANAARMRPDGQTELYVGQSGKDLKAGKEWMTPGEIEAAMGRINGALFSDPSKAIMAGDWYQAQAQQHGFDPAPADPIIGELGQAARKVGISPSPDETISNPFGEAFRQLGAVKDQVGGALQGAGAQFARNVTGANADQAEIERRFAGASALLPKSPLDVAGAALGAPTGGEISTEQRNQAIEQGNPLRDVPVVGGATTMAAQMALDPTNLLLMGEPGVARAAGRGVRAAGEIVGSDEAQALLRARQRGEGINPLSPPPIPSEVTPPAVTGPRVAKMAGTAAEQAAVGAPEEGRAANILLEKFPEDVRPHLQDVADKFGQFAGQRRGVITDDQALKNAAEVALGTTPEKWIKTPAGKAFNQEQAIALGNTLSEVGTEYDGMLADVLKARAGGTVTPQMEADLADKTLEFAALAGVRSGAAAEAGRALRAFRQELQGGAYADRNRAIDAAFKAIGTDKARFAQWVEEFSKLPADDPIAKYKMLQGLQEPSWWDRLSILRYASMLSSTSTHLVNAFGNTLNVGLDVALKPASVGIDVARAGITGGERTRYMGELAPQVHGLLEGAVAGLQDGLTTLKTGINPQNIGKFENVRAGFQSGSATVDTIAEAPLRLLTFSDNVFRSAAKGAQVRALAAREGIKAGKSGAELRAYIDDVVKNLPVHPGIAAEADKMAARSVLQEPNALASAVTSIGRGPGSMNMAKRIVREIVVPFSKTPLNILGQGLEMTPLGMLKVRDLAAAGEVGGATDAAARVVFGSALMVGVGALAAHGLVTGGYPADSKERDTLPPGWQPWSVRIPTGDGGHNYISFSQLGPVAIPMAIAAIAGQSMREGVIADPATLGGSLGKFMLDQTFLQGLSAIVDAVKDPKRYGENVSEQLATSFVPYAALSRQVTRALDQADRDPKGAIEAIQALIPGVAENVSRRQDALGRDIHSTQTGIGAFISPVRYGSDRPEPLLAAFRGVGEGLPSAPPEIRIPSKLTGSLSPPIKLTESEKNDYQRLFGQRLTELRGAQVASPDWETRTLASRKASLDAAVKAARDYAESAVYAKMAPDDRQRRMTEGRARLQVKPIPAP